MILIFTVIICGKQIIDDCFHKYSIYFEPFLKNNEIAFCEWNAEADSLETAVPQLSELIASKREWRAVVVGDNSIFEKSLLDSRNPFDYVGTEKKNYEFSTFDQVMAYRAKEQALLTKALCNPLARLSIWLCGSPIRSRPPMCYENEQERVESIKNSDAYFELLSELRLSAADIEIDRSQSLKYQAIENNFALCGELFNPPVSLFAVMQRASEEEEKKSRSAWVDHSEFDYSQFYNDNLYPAKMRYLIGDVEYLSGVRNENSYFSFLTALLILASNDCPRDALRPYRVYKFETHIDADRVRKLFDSYGSKLIATMKQIDVMIQKLNEQERRPLTNEEVEENFEAVINLPIEAVSKDEREEMMAEYRDIGLARDCPTDEDTYWDRQYDRIQKRFTRFLREPKRRVSTAAQRDFKLSCFINDDRIMRIGKYQKEDIEYVLDEEEHNMVSTVTPHLFNTQEYKEKIDEASYNIKRKISMRMPRKSIIAVAGIAASSFLVGFLPLILKNIQMTKSLMVALGITLASLLILLLCGFITLIVQRRILVNRFIHFNMTMSGVLNDIERGVAAFSDYLSHACNVMRAFSVLECDENPYETKRAILIYHKNNIKSKSREVCELFAAYTDIYGLQFDEDAKAYDFDFTVMREYEYVVPYPEAGKDIEFLQEGNVVAVPVDYVKSISLTREELYD